MDSVIDTIPFSVQLGPVKMPQNRRYWYLFQNYFLKFRNKNFEKKISFFKKIISKFRFGRNILP